MADQSAIIVTCPNCNSDIHLVPDAFEGFDPLEGTDGSITIVTRCVACMTTCVFEKNANGILSTALSHKQVCQRRILSYAIAFVSIACAIGAWVLAFLSDSVHWSTWIIVTGFSVLAFIAGGIAWLVGWSIGRSDFQIDPSSSDNQAGRI